VPTVLDDFFHVNFGGLDAITQDLVRDYTTLQTAWNDLTTKVPATLTAWVGPAQTEYAQVSSQVNALLQDMANVLHLSSKHTSYAVQTWNGAEAANQARVANIS
jgi:uncharacterized protein YukE